MIYLLDTSILIELLRNNSEAKDFLATHQEDTFITSAVCEAEVYEGVYREKSENISIKAKIFEELLTKFFEVVFFDSVQAEITGKIRADLSKSGHLIGDLDILIASSAIANQAILLTKNPKHFSRIKDLRLMIL